MRGPAQGPLLVVVVDDDPSVRTALSRLLRSVGLEVEVLASAGELLLDARPVQPACLVLDVHLPDVNGLDLLRQLVATGSCPAVVVLTGDLDPSLRTQALAAGATAFVTKPFDDGQLLAEVRRALGGSMR